MQPSHDTSKSGRPIVLTPGAVIAAGVLVVAGFLVFKVVSDAKPPPPVVPVAPAYPDLSPRVAELEQQLAAAKSAPPPYPDLSGRVASLESTQASLHRELAEAQAAPEYVVLHNRLAECETKLEALREALETARKSDGEARAERDDLADRASRMAGEVSQLRGDRERMQRLLSVTGRQLRQTSAERTSTGERESALAAVTEELQTTRAALATARDEASRTSDALAVLQRASARASAEVAASQTQLDRLRSTNAALTDENQRLKAAPVRPVASIAPVAPAPISVFASRTHLIAAGDTLANLSERYYGTSARWPEIYHTNADLLGPTGILRVGTVLRIP